MSMTQKEKAKVEQIMSLLGCTEEEALDVIETDNIIDKGGRTKYDLTKEQEKIAMKISAVNDRRAKDKETSQRGKVRAENPTKSGVIAKLFEFLNENGELFCENVTILNKERQIGFKIGEDSYELTLVQKRKPKK
jgi:hypothetical protein